MLAAMRRPYQVAHSILQLSVYTHEVALEPLNTIRPLMKWHLTSLWTLSIIWIVSVVLYFGTEWMRIALSKGAHQIMCFHLPEDGSKAGLRNVVLRHKIRRWTKPKEKNRAFRYDLDICTQTHLVSRLTL
jgi:hypothetical protein